MLCDEDVVRVLRRAGAHLTGLQLHGPQLTCAALLPLKACFGLQHVDLTGCVRVDALSLVAALPAADSFQLSSLMVDGINCQSLNDGAVCKLKALVGRGNIDISKCSLCSLYHVCWGWCTACGMDACNTCKDECLQCEVCDAAWCTDCEDGLDWTVRIGCDSCSTIRCAATCAFKGSNCMHICDDCGVVNCEDCALKSEKCMHYCSDCHQGKCQDCAFSNGNCMHYCSDCHEAKCQACAFSKGNCMHYCTSCHEAKCQHCAFESGFDSFMHYCDSCCMVTCKDCFFGKRQCCSYMYLDQ